MTTETAAMPPAPRQFALVYDEDDDQYAEFIECCHPTDPVLWWGFAVDDEAILYRRHGRHVETAHHTSPESALALWVRSYPVKLVWL